MSLEEKKRILAELLLQKAIDRGVKEYQQELARNYRERQLEVKFFKTNRN